MKPDDSGLQPFELAAVERQARELLDRASAWNRFPTPVEDILGAARLRVAPRGMFDAAAFGPLVVPCGIEAQNHWSSSSPVGMWAGCI